MTPYRQPPPVLEGPKMRVTVKPDIRLKRVYEPASPVDGLRILVDRVWPRGLRKADAAIDRWLKEIAPSSELRRWFGHALATGRSFTAATATNCPPIQMFWTSCARSRAKAD